MYCLTQMWSSHSLFENRNKILVKMTYLDTSAYPLHIKVVFPDTTWVNSKIFNELNIK